MIGMPGAGDPVIVLLPTATNKRLAKWQGLYPVCEEGGAGDLRSEHV